MARIRYLKPDFFFDEELCELPMACRLAFTGLWCHADKAGRMDDKPKKLKALIFPYERADMDTLLNQLSKKPFILRYTVDGKKYIQVVGWDKHQRPHHTEKDSTIPCYNGEITVKNQEGMGKGMEKGMGKGSDQNQFDRIWIKYPRKLGKKEAQKHFYATVKTEKDFEDIQTALSHYLQSKDVLRGFVQHGSTWFNNWQDWIDYEEKVCPKCGDRGKYLSKTGYEIICDCPKGK